MTSEREAVPKALDEATKLHTIFCFNNGGSPQWLRAIAIADDGHVLGQHICSHEGFMQHDLGITSDWKHENYDAHFGAGNWKCEWVPTDQRKTHEGLKAALALNALLPKEEAEKDYRATKAGASFELSDGTIVESSP